MNSRVFCSLHSIDKKAATIKITNQNQHQIDEINSISCFVLCLLFSALLSWPFISTIVNVYSAICFSFPVDFMVFYIFTSNDISYTQ